MTTRATTAVISTATAFEECARITRSASTNFYMAMQSLDRNRRNAIFAVYAFCRSCDDIVDEPQVNRIAAIELAQTRAKLAATCRDEPPGEPVWIALAEARQQFGIKQAHLEDVIAGCEMDLEKHRYTTFAELKTYCRRVASSVGLMVIDICGYNDDSAADHAVDLGIGTQLTNILRDLGEDLSLGRVYLPREDLERFGYSYESLLRHETGGGYLDLMRFQAERARAYFESGEKLFPLLDRRSRSCPETIYRVYRRLLDRIEASRFDVFSRRISLSRREKILFASRLWLKSKSPFLA